MKKYIYIHRDISKSNPLDSELDASSNEIATDWNGYVDGGWLLLSDEQVAFMQAYPEASHFEVWSMKLNPPPGSPVPHIPTVEDQAFSLMSFAGSAMFNIVSASLTDEQALQLPALHSKYSELDGETLEKGRRIQHNGKYYQLLTQFTVNLKDPNNAPSVHTASVYRVVADPSLGKTKEKAIPYDRSEGMELKKDLYYDDAGTIYLCTKDLAYSGPYSLIHLPGFVKKVE